MITDTERRRLDSIKAMTLSGHPERVSREDRQWVLDLLKREQVSTSAQVVTQAQKQGFDTTGIVVE